MAHRVHVLISRVLAPELAAAGLAVEGWCPVVEVIHVLGTGAIRAESSRAGLAFGPVVVVVHMLVAVTLVIEFIVAGCAVVHGGWMGGDGDGWSVMWLWIGRGVGAGEWRMEVENMGVVGT
jgi:hypothetical protein